MGHAFKFRICGLQLARKTCLKLRKDIVLKTLRSAGMSEQKLQSAVIEVSRHDFKVSLSGFMHLTVLDLDLSDLMVLACFSSSLNLARFPSSISHHSHPTVEQLQVWNKIDLLKTMGYVPPEAVPVCAAPQPPGFVPLDAAS